MADDLTALLAAHRARTADQLTEPYDQIPWVRSAVAAIYRTIYGTPLIAVSGERDGDFKPLPDTDPLSLLIARPNPFQSGAQFGASLVAYRKLDGVAYVALYGEGSTWWEPGRDVPREMLTLDPRRVSVAANGLDMRTGLITRYTVNTGAVPFDVPASAMLVFAEFNPRDLQRGSAPLSSVAAAMNAYYQSDAYVSSMLENDGTPGLILKLKAGLGDKERKALRDNWDDRHRGSRKARRTAVLGPDVDVQAPPPVMSAKDMEAIAFRAEVRDAIKAVLAVTDHEVGRVADYNRANSESAKAWLWHNSILPEMMLIEEILWSRIFEPLQRGKSGAKRWLKYDLSKVSALKPELGTTATTAATLINAGFDPQQVSEKLDLGLDYTEPEPEPEPVIVAPPPEPAKTAPHIWVKKAKPKPLPRRIAMRLQNQWADHAERKLGVQWRRFTAKRYAETIRLIRNTTDLGRVDNGTVERVLADAAAWRAGARAAAEAGLKGVGASLTGNFEAEIGGFQRIDVGQEVHQAAALRRVGQMVNVGTKLRGTIRDSITRAIADAGTDGVGIDGLEKIVEARFGGRLPSNAATVARTEVGIFSSDVRRSLMVAEGIDEHEWSASMDEHTRETHRAIDGERRPIGERFSNGMLHPLEAGAPASEVVNCRCVELPYMAEIKE